MNRRQAKIEARREQVSFLYRTGKTQAQIAAQLGMSQQIISYDLRQCRAVWQQKTLEHTDVMVAEQVAQIQLMLAEAWEAWFESKKPREISETEAVEGGHARRKAKLRKEASCGDAQFLTVIQKGLQQIAVLRGLNAPQKIAPTSPDGETPWEGMVVYLPSKAPSPEEWNQAVAQLIPLAQQEQN